jgi:hypothetical protein
VTDPDVCCVYVWLEEPELTALDALRGRDESRSDVILRLVAEREGR